jgi:hypothetical protein
LICSDFIFRSPVRGFGSLTWSRGTKEPRLQKPGYTFQGVINGATLNLLIKFGDTAGSYKFLAEGRRANLTGTTNPVTVTLSIGDNSGSTNIDAGESMGAQSADRSEHSLF